MVTQHSAFVNGTLKDRENRNSEKTLSTCGANPARILLDACCAAELNGMASCEIHASLQFIDRNYQRIALPSV